MPLKFGVKKYATNFIYISFMKGKIKLIRIQMHANTNYTCL